MKGSPCPMRTKEQLFHSGPSLSFWILHDSLDGISAQARLNRGSSSYRVGIRDDIGRPVQYTMSGFPALFQLIAIRLRKVTSAVRRLLFAEDCYSLGCPSSPDICDVGI